MKTLTTISFLVLPFLCFAQILDTPFSGVNTSMEDILEQLSQELDDVEFNLESFEDNLILALENPVDLNFATSENLAELGILSAQLIDALLNHRRRYGPLLNLYELQTIRGFDLLIIIRILPFVSIDENQFDRQTPMSKQLLGGKHEFYTRYTSIIEDQKGYMQQDTTRAYLGSRAKIYARYKYHFGNRISYGLTAEKDQGEEFFKGSQKSGFDFYSAHFHIRELGLIKDLTLGDYEIKIGQGLMIWSGFGFGKSAYVMDVRKTGRSIRQYSSVNENRFLRGIAIRTSLGNENSISNFDLSLWGSYKSIDGNPNDTNELDTLSTEESLITSFTEDGFHRNETELLKKDAVKETIGGVAISFRKRNWEAGIAAMQIRFDIPFKPEDRPDNVFDFKGDRLSSGTFYYSGSIQNFSLFGETAISDNGAFASLHGVQISLHSRVDFVAVYRYYDKAYQSFYANGFAEQADIGNESGIYLGLAIKLAKRWELNLYADLYQHPWLRFNADGPSAGRDFLAQLNWSPRRSLKMYWRVKHEIKTENAVNNQTPSDFLVDIRKSGFRYDLAVKINTQLRLKSRAEWIWFNNSVDGLEKGFLIYQDIQWKLDRVPLVFTLRYSIFDIESFDARIYAYENDVLYAFSIPAFNDKGSRYYILTRWKVNAWSDIWLRFSRTGYKNKETTGTDLDEISVPHKSELKAML
ncbi:MAG: hypothetical protein ACI959_001438, partial [Limisphaerales bacterium]